MDPLAAAADVKIAPETVRGSSEGVPYIVVGINGSGASAVPLQDAIIRINGAAQTAENTRKANQGVTALGQQLHDKFLNRAGQPGVLARGQSFRAGPQATQGFGAKPTGDRRYGELIAPRVKAATVADASARAAQSPVPANKGAALPIKAIQRQEQRSALLRGAKTALEVAEASVFNPAATVSGFVAGVLTPAHGSRRPGLRPVKPAALSLHGLKKLAVIADAAPKIGGPAPTVPHRPFAPRGRRLLLQPGMSA